jgi:hypothetical protein
MYLELVIHSDRVIRSASNLQKILLSTYETPSQLQNWRQVKERATMSWIQCCESRSDRGPEIFGRADLDPVSSFPVRFQHEFTSSTTLFNTTYSKRVPVRQKN